MEAPKTRGSTAKRCEPPAYSRRLLEKRKSISPAASMSVDREGGAGAYRGADPRDRLLLRGVGRKVQLEEARVRPRKTRSAGKTHHRMYGTLFDAILSA